MNTNKQKPIADLPIVPQPMGYDFTEKPKGPIARLQARAANCPPWARPFVGLLILVVGLVTSPLWMPLAFGYLIWLIFSE
jgi:hypothetical protein